MTWLRKRSRADLVLLALAGLWAAPSAADIAVVTAARTAVETLDEPQAKALWLGTVERVGAVKLTVADRSDAEIRAEFYSRVLHKTRGQVKAIRAKRAFQFGIAPPPELPNDASVLSWVTAKQNRLGYVDAAALEPVSEEIQVKVLLVIEVPQRSQEP